MSRPTPAPFPKEQSFLSSVGMPRTAKAMTKSDNKKPASVKHPILIDESEEFNNTDKIDNSNNDKNGNNKRNDKKFGLEPLEVDREQPSRRGKTDNDSHIDDGIDFLKDDPKSMTGSRRIALFMMRRFKWYYPKLGAEDMYSEDELEKPQDALDAANMFTTSPTGAGVAAKASQADCYPFSHSMKENPSLEKAWAYFEHVTLPRYVVKPKADDAKKCFLIRIIRKFSKGNKQLDRAEPGEKGFITSLYDPMFTPHKQLGDWGLGIGLYFSTLRGIALLTFLAGVLNTPNFMYFSSAEYSDGQQGLSTPLTKGSAICTDQRWVVCPGCDPANFWKERFANGTDASGMNVTFALRNFCDGVKIEQAMFSYGTFFLIVIGIAILNIYVRRTEVIFDEDEQTAQDYSILINNPPHDATDPEEWRNFFYDNFDGAYVTVCTVAVDNDLLVRTLVERREKLRTIQMMLEPGTSMDTLSLAKFAAKIEQRRKFFGRMMASLSPGLPEHFGRLVALNVKVQGLAQQEYPATRIFVTFETEADQRRVLSGLSVGAVHVMRNNKDAVSNPKHLFRGEHVLGVEEPEEPNTVRWSDLNEKFKDRAKQQAMTSVATVISIVLIAFIVNICNNVSAAVAAFTISIFNSLFPTFAKSITGLEAHGSEGGKQRSMYFKIAVFRWVNTAIVITIITPFTYMLTDKDGLIVQIYALFFAEIVTTTAIQIADPMGHIQRHYLAPRAKTQDAMNLLMKGADIELAERYTNMTKLLFLALWYCTLFPGALFMCSFALTINYFADRFSLMRTWKRIPSLGGLISEFSRQYFFPAAVFGMITISAYFWAGFPFDDLCETEGSSTDSYAGTYTVETYANETAPFSVVVPAGEQTFHYCLQDFFRFPKGHRSYPFVPENQIPGQEWMTHDQELVTTIFGWTAVGCLIIILLSFCGSVWKSFRDLFRSTYESKGEDQGICFSDVPSISSYIPEVRSPAFAYPLLASNTDDIDLELLEWTDPDRPHSFYDLTKDAAVLLRDTDWSTTGVFSRVGHWPPPGEETYDLKAIH